MQSIRTPNDEDTGFSRGERLVDRILDVDDIETIVATLTFCNSPPVAMAITAVRPGGEKCVIHVLCVTKVEFCTFPIYLR